MNDDLEMFNQDAEERYLMALLLSASLRNLRDEALTQISPDDFANARYGGLWAAAGRLREAGKRIDRRTLVVESEGPGDEHALSQFAGVVPLARDFPEALSAVKRSGKLRRLIEAAVRIQQRATIAEDFSQAYGWAVDELNKLQAVEESAETRSFADLLQEFGSSMDDPSLHTITPTPWGEVNERIAGGLHGGRLYIVGARPGEGKSIVAHNLAEFAASLGYPAQVFSVEMGALEVTGRMVANGAQIQQDEINRFRLTAESVRSLHEYTERATSYPLFINDRPDLSIGYIKSEARAAKRRHGLRVVVVDYLQLLSSDRSLPREQQVAHVSRSLKQLSRELDVAVVVPAQLNRNSVGRDKQASPTLADLRESGSIEADADVVMLLARQYFTEGDMRGTPNGMVTVDIAKNRHGRIGPLELPFRGHYSRIG